MKANLQGSAAGCECAKLEIRDVRFRSVGHSDILSERPATLAIILMSRLSWDRRNVEASPRTTCTGPTVQVDNEAEPRRSE